MLGLTGSCPTDEWARAFALKFTRLATNRTAKGVVYHDTGGAYSVQPCRKPMSWQMTLFPRYLTIVPMFHCKRMVSSVDAACAGWGHALPARRHGGLVFMTPSHRRARTHLAGAPIVLQTIIHAKEHERKPFDPYLCGCSPPGRRRQPQRWPRSNPWAFDVTQGLWPDGNLWPGYRMPLAMTGLTI